MKYYILDTKYKFNGYNANKVKKFYDSPASFEIHLRRAIERARYCTQDVNVYNEHGEIIATVYSMGYDKTPQLKMIDENAIA